MKKRLASIVALIMSMFIIFSATSCNLITIDTERDGNQVVATVQIEEDAPKKEILKDELTVAYMNYGYQYSGSYTSAEIYDILIENLVETEIEVQSIISQYDKDANYPIKNQGYNKWDVQRYLTIENTQEDLSRGIEFKLSEVNKAKYQAIKFANDLIEVYEEVEEEKYQDTDTQEVRKAPSTATVDTEVSDKEKAEYISAGIITGEIGSKRLTAYNKVIKLMEQAGLLGDDFDGTFETTTYYQDIYNSGLKSELIEKYENSIRKQARDNIDFSALEERYEEMYNAQKESFKSETTFASQLSSATAQNPIVYSPYSGYGYVYNLLLGTSDILTAEIINIAGGNIQNKLTTDAQREKRMNALKATTVKDLRSTWITNGYDFDTNTNKFTGDYTLVKNSANSLQFQGEVVVLKEKTEKESGEYRVNPKVFGLDEFLDFMDTYLYGAKKDSEQITNKNIYKKVSLPKGSSDEYDAKVKELLFAFSTDPGSLDTYKGYVISPKPSESGKETYMSEFADAGRELLEMGGNSYIVVATNYGLHVMFYSQKLNSDINFDTLVKYLNAQTGENKDRQEWIVEYNKMIENFNDYKNTESYLYLSQALYSNKLEETALSENKSEMLAKYRHDTNCVKIYTERFQDLRQG